MSGALPGQPLTADDLAMYAAPSIGPDLLAEAHVKRVTDAEARRDYGVITTDATQDMSGIVYPYFHVVTGQRTTCRVRRDHPEIDPDGKIRNKYVSAFGDGRHLYFPPGAAAKLQQADMPICLVEAEKSALALTAWAARTGTNLLPVAMGGCWGWKGQHIGKAIAPDGERVDVAGPLPDLSYCDGRKVYVLLDANVATNPEVARAERALVAELRKRKCQVFVCDLPVLPDTNGPDDCLAVAGDDAMAEVFDAAHPPTRKPAIAPEPKPATPAAPPLSAQEAAALTSDLLDTCRSWILRYIVLSDAQAIILAAWVLHTYAFDAAETTPYIHITAPEKACGKSRLMETMEAIAATPVSSSGMTAAALVRCIDLKSPTIFLDEMDAQMHGDKEYAEAIRGILNAGFRKGGCFYKCDGKSHELRPYKAYSPKCFAGIGQLWDTVASRCVVIEMRRKLPGEAVEPFRQRTVKIEAAPIKTELESWAARGTAHLLTVIQPAAIVSLSDRQNDIAEPLLAIAHLAGGDWLQRLTAALLAVFKAAGERDASTGVTLLADIRAIFDRRGCEHIPSREIAADLCQIEGRPWAEWSHGRGLSANNVARQLKPYGVLPLGIRVGESTPKGYRKADFADAWSRYCPLPPLSNSTTPQPAPSLAETVFSNRNTAPLVAVAKSGSNPYEQRVVADVAVEKPVYTHESLFALFEQPGKASAKAQPGVADADFDFDAVDDKELQPSTEDHDDPRDWGLHV